MVEVGVNGDGKDRSKDKCHRESEEGKWPAIVSTWQPSKGSPTYFRRK